MKAIVTGGAGFIGSNLVASLLEDRHEVICIDNNPVRGMMLTGLKHHDNLKCVWKDILFIDPKRKDYDDVDIVYHLASSCDIRKSLQDTELDLNNNVIGTHRILELMRHNDIPKLVFTSSSIVYGNASIIPTPEDYPNLQPTSLYGASKLGRTV